MVNDKAVDYARKTGVLRGTMSGLPYMKIFQMKYLKN